MRRSWCRSLIACLGLGLVCPNAFAVESVNQNQIDSAPISATVRESTMPASYVEEIKPELAARYTFKADRDFTAVSGLPTYEWIPTQGEPRAVVVAVHGLTLHGRRYRVLARLLAANGIPFIAMDMRGFGRCKFDSDFSAKGDDHTKVDHSKSYDEIVKILEAVRKKYPGSKVIVMGESLGCSFAVRAAGEHHDLVDGVILSAPAVKLNAKMYIGNGTVMRGIKAAVLPSHTMDLHSFIQNLVSPRPEIVNEMLDDPHILKSLPLGALLSTDEFVGRTAEWGKGVAAHAPVLIIQGSIDNCVSAKHVTDLTNAMASDDQTIAWRGKYGHLQLETLFMRASILNAIVDWLYNHGADMQSRLLTAQDAIKNLGGRIDQ